MTSLAQSRASENIVIDYNKPPVTLIRLLTSVSASFTHPENLNFSISYNIFTHIQQPNKLIDQKNAFTFYKSSTPTGLVRHTNMAAVTSCENAQNKISGP